MRKSILVIMLAGTTALAGCANNPRVAQGATVGGLGGAAVGAVVPGVSVVEGALAGAAIGGLPARSGPTRTTTAMSTAMSTMANIMPAPLPDTIRRSAASRQALGSVARLAPVSVQ
jgi:hypothetical protein